MNEWCFTILPFFKDSDRKHPNSSWECWWESRNINLALWSGIGHFKKLLTAYFYEIVDSSRQRHMPYSPRNNSVNEWVISWSCNLPLWWLQLAALIMRSNAVGFLTLGFLKSKVYDNKPTTTHTLKEESECCIN